jgi:hypothetical protein
METLTSPLLEAPALHDADLRLTAATIGSEGPGDCAPVSRPARTRVGGICPTSPT